MGVTHGGRQRNSTASSGQPSPTDSQGREEVPSSPNMPHSQGTSQRRRRQVQLTTLSRPVVRSGLDTQFERGLRPGCTLFSSTASFFHGVHEREDESRPVEKVAARLNMLPRLKDGRGTVHGPLPRA